MRPKVLLDKFLFALVVVAEGYRVSLVNPITNCAMSERNVWQAICSGSGQIIGVDGEGEACDLLLRCTPQRQRAIEMGRDKLWKLQARVTRVICCT